MCFLAEAAGGDHAISGDWLLKVIAAIFTGVALIAGRYWGRKEAASESRDVTLKKPVPTVVTRSEASFATKPDLDDHVVWTRAEFGRVWGQFGTERSLENEELARIHERINQQALATAGLKGTVEEIGSNVNQLLHLALHGKTPPRTR